MLSFLPRRLLQLIPTLFLVSVLIFLLQQLLPGDPALVRRLCYESVDGKPLMCGVSFYRADQIRFAIRLPYDSDRRARRSVAPRVARESAARAGRTSRRTRRVFERD